MPHVIIEYTPNIMTAAEVPQILHIAHNVMIESGLFSTKDIKTRSYIAQDFLVGENGNKGNFMHVTIYLLEGRTLQQKQNLGKAMKDTLLLVLKNVEQFSVDIRELVKDTYQKIAL